MACQDARAEILQLFDDGLVGKEPAELRAHLAGCPACAAFAASQQALDLRLRAMLPPPELSPAFRPALRRRIRRESIRLWSPSLLDVVHFASCGAATIVSAVLLPFDALIVLGAGAAATTVSYLVLAAVRDWFEDAESMAL